MPDLDAAAALYRDVLGAKVSDKQVSFKYYLEGGISSHGRSSSHDSIVSEPILDLSGCPFTEMVGHLFSLT